MHFHKCLNCLLHFLLFSSTILASTVEEVYLEIAKAEFTQKKGEHHLTELEKIGPKLAGANKMANKLRAQLKRFKNVLNEVSTSKVKDRLAMQKPDKLFTDVQLLVKVTKLKTLLHYETPNWFNVITRGQLYKSMIGKLKNPTPGEDNSQLVAPAERALDAFAAKTKELGIGKAEGIKLSWREHSVLKSLVNKVKGEIARLPTYHKVISKDFRVQFTLPERDGFFKRNPKLTAGLVAGGILGTGFVGTYLTDLLAELVRGKNGAVDDDPNEASQAPLHVGEATRSDMSRFSSHETNPIIVTDSRSALWSLLVVISVCVFLLILLLFACVFYTKRDNNKLGRTWKKRKNDAKKRGNNKNEATSPKQKTRKSAQTKKKSSETKKKQTSPNSTTETTRDVESTQN